MKFERELTLHEQSLLGPNPSQRLNKYIDEVLNPNAAVNRLFSVMSNQPMTCKQILMAHNIMYGGQVIKTSYARLLLSKMSQCGMVVRHERGVYVRA